MKLEVQRARKRKITRENRAELRRELNPASQSQPQERSLRYENVRSARAEQGVLRLLLLDEGLFPAGPSLVSCLLDIPFFSLFVFMFFCRRQQGVRRSTGGRPPRCLLAHQQRKAPGAAGQEQEKGQAGVRRAHGGRGRPEP